MQTRHIKHPFPPVIDENSLVLILGSVPSVKSVEHNFYYMHPQNRFWRVLSRLFDTDLYNADTEFKIKFLLAHRLALYDSIEECDILGSSDNNISCVVYADIPSLLEKSNIKHIFCNGKASYRYLIKAYPQYENITIPLPSTSPANAAYSIDRLLSDWQIISDCFREI